MGPSSDRQSNAQTPVVPRVAQTWRKIEEVNVRRWALVTHLTWKKTEWQISSAPHILAKQWASRTVFYQDPQ